MVWEDYKCLAHGQNPKREPSRVTSKEQQKNRTHLLGMRICQSAPPPLNTLELQTTVSIASMTKHQLVFIIIIAVQNDLCTYQSWPSRFSGHWYLIWQPHYHSGWILQTRLKYWGDFRVRFSFCVGLSWLFRPTTKWEHGTNAAVSGPCETETV